MFVLLQPFIQKMVNNWGQKAGFLTFKAVAAFTVVRDNYFNAVTRVLYILWHIQYTTFQAFNSRADPTDVGQFRPYSPGGPLGQTLPPECEVSEFFLL